ncbi:MAG: histidine phosphatase family protein, partial [Desulfobacterales bacterium]
VILIGLFQIAFVSCMSGNVKSAPGTTTKIILIRHAEKTGKGLVDGSYLSPAGRERSRALVSTVKDMGITAIYSPDIGRNLETVRPLSRQLGVAVTINKSLITTFAVDEMVAEILSKHAGGVVLYVGNVSGNLMAMHRYLGGSGTGPGEYGEMTIFVISDKGTISVTESHFGN